MSSKVHLSYDGLCRKLTGYKIEMQIIHIVVFISVNVYVDINIKEGYFPT